MVFAIAAMRETALQRRQKQCSFSHDYTDELSMFEQNFDSHKRRLHIRYAGLWSTEEAQQYVQDFRQLLGKAASNGPFTLLDDLREWPTQTRDVAEICNVLPEIVLEMPVSRNAMIISQALLRMQVSRTLANLPHCRLFDNYGQADVWLSEVEVRHGRSSAA
jgi:hypothetical protein